MPDREALARATLEAQTRLHGRSLIYLPGATLAVALTLAGILWPQSEPLPLLGWLSGVALVLLLHLGLHLWQREGVAREPAAPRWRLHHRMVIALQGMAWAALAVVMNEVPEGQGHDAIAFAAVAMIAGWITTGSFDRVSVALFTVPALLPAGLHFWAHGHDMSALNLGGTVLVAVMMLLAAHRGYRAFLSSVERRLAGERAANQARVLEQLLQNTEQGVWFLDNQGLTTDLNAAMARLLGRDREAVLGRSVFDYLAGADLANPEPPTRAAQERPQRRLRDRHRAA